MSVAVANLGLSPLDADLRERLAPLLGYLEALPAGQRADLDELHRILESLEVGELESLTRFSDGGYTRLRLAGTEQFEVLLMGWKPGQQSPIHDHARSVCGARVIAGVASEVRFRFTPSGHLLAEGTTAVPVGQVCASQDADVHLIANYETSN